jgi:hypothetical protein
MLLDVQERGGVPRARHDARRRRRRGLRQGRAPARARLPGRQGDRRARRPGRSRGVRLPGRARAGARLLVLRAEDRAALPRARPRPADELERRRADLAASYQRAIVRALVERIEATGGERIAVVGGVAANSELRAALPGAALAPLALCTDNAAMIASAARFTDPVPYPEYLSLDAPRGVAVERLLAVTALRSCSRRQSWPVAATPRSNLRPSAGSGSSERPTGSDARGQR